MFFASILILFDNFIIFVKLFPLLFKILAYYLCLKNQNKDCHAWEVDYTYRLMFFKGNITESNKIFFIYHSATLAKDSKDQEYSMHSYDICESYCHVSLHMKRHYMLCVLDGPRDSISHVVLHLLSQSLLL